MRLVIYILLMIFCSGNLFAQDKLNQELLSECEIFKQKKDYDVNERWEFIKMNNEKRVTIFRVKGKDNVIKHRFDGIMYYREDHEYTSIGHKKPTIEDRASVLLVRRREGNKILITVPLTDSKKYRIYFTDCIEELPKND